MRFRIVFPVVSVLLSALLFYAGDRQVRETLKTTNGGSFEGMPLNAASAKYIDYAINAPAWAILMENREMRWSPSTYWTGRDLRYFIALVVMWYLLGFGLDKKIAGLSPMQDRHASPSKVVLAVACIL